MTHHLPGRLSKIESDVKKEEKESKDESRESLGLVVKVLATLVTALLQLAVSNPDEGIPAAKIQEALYACNAVCAVQYSAVHLPLQGWRTC